MTFRAENGIRLSELSQRLGIPERELAYAEKFNEVDSELADKIIAEYNLPNDYFTEEVEVIAQNNGRPFKYFLLLAFIWQIITGIAVSLTSIPFSFMDLTDIKGKVSAAVSLINAVIIIASCILTSRYFAKNNSDSAEFGKHKYLFRLIPSGIVLIFNIPIALIRKALLSSVGLIGGNMITSLLTLIPSAAELLIIAYMMKTAVNEPKSKKLDIFFLCSAVSSVLYYILNPILFPAHNAVMQWVRAGFLALVSLAVALGLLVGRKRKPTSNDIWYMTLPIIALLAPSVLSLVMNFI